MRYTCIEKFSKKGIRKVTGVRKITKQTDNRFLNMYKLEAERRNGEKFDYFMASRAEKAQDTMPARKTVKANGVLIYGVYGDKVALIRQFRYPLGTYVYEFPAGLVEEGEDVKKAAVREMKEETGLTLTPLDAGCYEKPFFTSTGLTDETCAAIFGHLSGEPTNKYQEESEDIQVVLADKNECRRILREENVAIMCAYMLMHFVNDEEPFGFLKNVCK